MSSKVTSANISATAVKVKNAAGMVAAVAGAVAILLGGRKS
jgi:hypothetical protein